MINFGKVMAKPKFLLVFIILSICSLASYARVYQVELEIFRNNMPSLIHTESYAEPTSLPDFRKTKVLDEVENNISINEEQTGSKYPLFKTLPDVTKRLDLGEQFQELDRFTQIVSIAWNHPRNNSQEVYIASKPRYFGKIELNKNYFKKNVNLLNMRKLLGAVKLEIDRLMFLELDFIYDHEEFGVVQLKEKRRIKLNELNYFDHPLFGIVALISPID